MFMEHRTSLTISNMFAFPVTVTLGDGLQKIYFVWWGNVFRRTSPNQIKATQQTGVDFAYFCVVCVMVLFCKW